MDNSSSISLQDASDEVLIQHFKAGRTEVFDLLYYRHLPAVYKRVRYVVPAEDVEDVTQDIFIAVLNSLAAFRGDAKFSTWLRTLTNHKVAEFYRKRARKQEPPLSPLSHAANRSSGGAAKKMEDKIYLQRGLQALPENYREVILLRFAEGMQFHEIAELTNQNLEAVKSLFRRAIAALRSHLEE